MEQAGENIQHFMSDSSWEARRVCQQVQADIKATPILHSGALLVDESADAKAGLCSAGSGRQRNGRLGKIDLCQVGVFLTFVMRRPVWASQLVSGDDEPGRHYLYGRCASQ